MPAWRNSRSPRDFKPNSLRGYRGGSVAAVPFAGLLFFGDIVIPLVFGKTWVESGLIAQILAIGFFLAGPNLLTEGALTATGRPRDLVKLRLLSTLISAPLIFIIGMMGTKFVALSFSLRAIVLLPLYRRATYFLTGLSTYQTLRIAVLPYLVALSSACLARGVFQLAHAMGIVTIFALALGILVGALSFLAIFFKIGQSEVRSIVHWRHSAGPSCGDGTGK